MRTHHALAAATLTLAVACATTPDAPPPDVVERVDLQRYAGTWFDVGHFPAPFQDDCVCATATYEVVSPTEVAVTNRCRKDTPEGELDEIKGTARLADASEPAKLGVKFFPFITAPYWIVALDDDYRWAVVSEPDRKYLWILSRTPELDEQVRAQLIDELSARGFDMQRLLPSGQVAGCPAPA